MSEPFIFLEHTADAKFKAFGSNLEEAFANAAAALVSLMWNPAEVPASARRSLRVNGIDLKQLLRAFLEEVLYEWEVHGFRMRAVEEIRIHRSRSGHSLHARLSGDSRAEGAEVFGDVKAVTYHDMEIKTEDRVSVQVVVDV